MAQSGSFDYIVTASDVMTDALENIQVIEGGESIASADSALALRTLNLLVKQWSSLGDQMPGMKVWLHKEVFLFPQKSQYKYTLGPSAQTSDKATENYTRTTLSAGEPASETSIAVTDGSASANSDVIGIVLDDGTIHWSTISSGGTTNTLTIATGLASIAAAGNYVYFYTTPLAFKPLEILHATLRDPNLVDRVSITIPRDINLYNEIADKTVVGLPEMAWYEPKILTGILTFNCAFGNFFDIVRMQVLSPADDLDATTDNLAFPAEAFAALGWELGMRLAPKFGKPWTQEMQKAYDMAVGTFRYINLPGAGPGYNSDDGGNCDSL